jgi:putative spermidine/putrescine transport system substrate-binding protein
MGFLIKHKKDRQFRTFWNGLEQGVQLIANQEVWVMTGWESIVYAARRRGLDCYYAAPKEGYEAWSNNTILLKGAVDRKRSKTAHQLANARDALVDLTSWNSRNAKRASRTALAKARSEIRTSFASRR